MLNSHILFLEITKPDMHVVQVGKAFECSENNVPSGNSLVELCLMHPKTVEGKTSYIAAVMSHPVINVGKCNLVSQTKKHHHS